MSAILLLLTGSASSQTAKLDNERLIGSLKAALPLLPLAQQHALVATCPEELGDVALPHVAAIAPAPRECGAAAALCSSERCTPLSSLSAPSVAHFPQQAASSDAPGASGGDAGSVAAGGLPRLWDLHDGLAAACSAADVALIEVTSESTLPQVASLGANAAASMARGAVESAEVVEYDFALLCTVRAVAVL